MKLSKAAKIWIDYHKTHSKINTMRAYPGSTSLPQSHSQVSKNS